MDPFLLSKCNDFCFINSEIIKQSEVIEVGSINVNGSFRDIIEKWEPKKYIGVDIENGIGVDEICSIHDICKKYGEQSFDIVVCTEVIEHIQDWRNAIHQLMNICKIGGYIFLTSRSKGFGQHNYPSDFWRYEIEDICVIFQHWEIIKLCKDEFRGDHPGFFLIAKKHNNLIPDLSDMVLYNIETDPRHMPTDSKLKRTLD